MVDSGFEYRGSITVNKDTIDFSELESYLPIAINNLFFIKCLDESVTIGNLIFNKHELNNVMALKINAIISKKTITHKEELIPENFEQIDYFERRFTFAQIIQYCREISLSFAFTKIHSSYNCLFRIKRSAESWSDAIILYPNGKLNLKNRNLVECILNATDWECEAIVLNNNVDFERDANQYKEE